MEGVICRAHWGSGMAELCPKAGARGSVSEAGKAPMLQLLLLLGDCQGLGPPYIPASVATERTDMFRSHCHALILRAATSDPYLWCCFFPFFYYFVFGFEVGCVFICFFSPLALEEKDDSLMTQGGKRVQ